MKPVDLKTQLHQHQEAVRELLDEAKERGMIDVTIMGSLPGAQYCILYSKSMDRTMQIGYLEQAKFHILQGMKGEG